MCLAFLHGFCLAFGLIIPLGIQNVFVFNQGATQPRFIYALPSILTAAVCDSFLIILAVLGVSLIVLQMLWLRSFIFAIGFLFLVYMGFVTWRAEVRVKETDRVSLSATRQVIFAFSVSILNPHAVIDSIAVIGSNSLSYSGAEKGIFALACVLVSWLWFFALAFVGHKMHEFDQRGVWLARINKLSALVIWSVAVYIAWQFLRLIYVY